MPDEEWDALGPDEQGRGEQTHPQYHLKLLLDRMGIGRGEVQVWPASGRSRLAGRAGAGGRQRDDRAADFSDKWSALQAARAAAHRSARRRVRRCCRRSAGDRGGASARRWKRRARRRRWSRPTGCSRGGCRRCSQRWGIEADDSAGRPLSETPAGTLLLGIAAAAAEELAPVPLLALLKHPLVGGEGDDRLRWLETVRTFDLALRGPRPAAGLEGSTRTFASARRSRNIAAARRVGEAAAER